MHETYKPAEGQRVLKEAKIMFTEGRILKTHLSSIREHYKTRFERKHKHAVA
jgi:hypothetical protein